MRRFARSGAFVRPFCAVLALMFFLFVCACTSTNEAPLSALPETHPNPGLPRLSFASSSQYGLSWLELVELPFAIDAEALPEVSVGKSPCLLPEMTGAHSLRCLLPGAATAGSTELVVRSGAQQISLPFLYTPALDARFAKVVALGAAQTAGLRDSALTLSGQLHSLPAFIAKALGAYFPQALVASGIPYTPSLNDLNMAQGAILKSRSVQAWQSFLPHAPSPETLRLSTTQATQNLALPGVVGELGPLSPATGDASDLFLQQVLRLPTASETTPALLQSAAPTLLVIGPDLLDTLSPWADETTLEDEVVDAALAPLLDALSALPNAPLLVFTTSPETNLLPAKPFSGFARYRAIAFANALQRAVLTLNAADPAHPRAVLADAYGFFMDFLSAAEGQTTLASLPLSIARGDNGENNARVVLDDGRSLSLGLDRLEGLYSLDGASYSDTANALLANIMLNTLDNALGPNAAHPLWQGALPRLDVLEVIAADAVSPRAIEAERQRLGLLPLAAYADPSATAPWHTAERCGILWRETGLSSQTLCPSSLTFAQGAALNLYNGQQAVVTVLVLNRDGSPLRNTPVAAHAARGTLAGDYITTDDEGNARFRYSAPVDGSDDEVRAFCGTARKRLRIRLSTAPSR